MEAFKLLVTIERTIELRFKVDTIRFIIPFIYLCRLFILPLLHLFGSISFRLDYN